jgi:hypothetical protein
MLADYSRSGEAHLADDRTCEQVARDLVGYAEYQLAHALRKTRVKQCLHYGHCGCWSLLGRFEDDRAAGRDRRAQFTSRIVDREIPRRERGDGADRLMHHQATLARRADENPAVYATGFLSVEVEKARRTKYLDPGLGDRLAFFPRRIAGNDVRALAQ